MQIDFMWVGLMDVLMFSSRGILQGLGKVVDLMDQGVMGVCI